MVLQLAGEKFAALPTEFKDQVEWKTLDTLSGVQGKYGYYRNSGYFLKGENLTLSQKLQKLTGKKYFLKRIEL